MMCHAVIAASLYYSIILIRLNPKKYNAKGLSSLKSKIAILREQYKYSIEYKILFNTLNLHTIPSNNRL